MLLSISGEQDDHSSGTLTGWRTLLKSEDEGKATGQTGAGLMGGAALQKGIEGPWEQQAGGLHHRRVTSRAREMTVVLHSALVKFHLQHSVPFWDSAVTANTLRNWRGSSGEPL